MTKVDLKLDWCSHEAAKYAVEKWHYSHCMPVGKIVKIGVWENRKYIGAILYCHGNNQYQGDFLELKMQEIVELSRVALTKHVTPVSRIVSISLKMLKAYNTALRCVFSYADPEQSHVGGIYQAMNWVFIGTGGSTNAFFDKQGKRIHSRNVSSTGVKEHFGRYTTATKSSDVISVKLTPKYKYLFPLDDAMRKQIAPLAKPYPKRQHAVEVNKDTAGDQLAEGGAIPTQPLIPKLAE